MTKTLEQYDTTWDDLVKFGVIVEADEFTNVEEFVDIVTSSKRDPLAKMSPKFISKLSQTSGYKEQAAKTTEKRNMVLERETIERLRERPFEELPALPDEVRTRVQEARKQQIEKTLKRSIPRVVTPKRLRQIRAEIKETGIELTPDVKQIFETKENS